MSSSTVRFPLVQLLLLFVSVHAARADAPKPGIYAVVCGAMYRGDTREAALRSCERALTADRYLDKRVCSCRRHADIIRFEAGTQPAFFVAYSAHRAPTPAKATARCRAAERAFYAQLPPVPKEAWPCEHVEAVYGPYQRKPYERGYDDSRLYRFLNERGEWVDENGTTPCLVAGTLITTPYGDRPIETLVPGDLVSSWLPQEGRLILARITRVKQRTVAAVLELRLADGRSLRATDNHPLWSPTRQEWIPAGQFRAGDTLGILAGSEVHELAIRSIVTVPCAEPAKEIAVYDLTVEPTHAYFANGVYTHNY